MANRLGLGWDDYNAYCRTLVRPGHKRRVRVQVLRLSDGQHLSSLTPHILDGQVTVDVTTDHTTPTRILDFTFLDVFDEADIDEENARSRIIKVIDSRYVDELEDWIDCEVFTGVGWSCDSEGPEKTVVAHGLERQALGNRWKPRHWPKKTRKTDIIKQALRDVGEPARGIPDLGATTPERFNLAPMDLTWPELQGLASSMDRQLFYNGGGLPRLRRPPGRAVFTFGVRHLLTEVAVTRTPGGFNTFWVKGANPKGPKKRVEAKAHLRPRHPNSSDALVRDGELHYVVQEEQNDKIKTAKEAKARAKRLREDASRRQVEYTFDVVPVPHLEENDLVKVVTDRGTVKLRMKRWAFPLSYEGSPPMAVGSTRRLTKARGGGRGRGGQVQAERMP